MFYFDFLSRTFAIGRVAGEGGGYFFNFHLPNHIHLDISRTIAAESTSLQIASSRTRIGKLEAPGTFGFQEKVANH